MNLLPAAVWPSRLYDIIHDTDLIHKFVTSRNAVRAIKAVPKGFRYCDKLILWCLDVCAIFEDWM